MVIFVFFSLHCIYPISFLLSILVFSKTTLTELLRKPSGAFEDHSIVSSGHGGGAFRIINHMMEQK